VKNQEVQNNNANIGDQPLVDISSGSTINNISNDINIFKTAKDNNSFNLNIELKNDKISGTFSIFTGLLSKPYSLKLKVVDENNTKLDIAAFEISAALASVNTSFGGFQSSGWELLFSEISKSGTKPLNFVIEIPEFKSILFYATKNLNQIKK
jgi:hypothetical protein